MRMLIVTPAGAQGGNRITAERWSRLLRNLGQRVQIAPEYRDQPCDVLVALHARKSAASIRRFRRTQPAGPLIVALTGTDLYGDLGRSPAARRSIELATRIVVLQPDAVSHVPRDARGKVRVIVQSAAAPRRPALPRRRVFDVCVIGHLRTVKDPFRAALASRLLPRESRIVVTQVGAALSEDMRRRAERESGRNPRYEWRGAVSHAQARRILARSRLLVVTSRLEGGANVVSEALAADVPVISSRISGSIGLLGNDYPGYFAVGATRELADLLWRCESDPAFYRDLRRRCRRLAPLIHPARERQAWQTLLEEIAGG
jgi:putative glycosyltransferase (TIGR04348 family)